MSGGKSSSSTATTSSQSTSTADASAVAGDVLQGEITYTVNDEFSDNVESAFLALVNLANNTIEGAGTLATNSIEKVSERSAQIENPDLATTQEFLPYLLAGGVIIAAVIIWKK